MKQDKASKTAEAAAAVRFSHMLHDEPKIFEDEFAADLTSSTWKFICTNRLLYQIVVRGVLRSLRPVHGLILGRSRYSEEKLEEAIRRGVCQYVILGAGLDSYAFRRAVGLQRLSVFEVDHPASQLLKRERLARLEMDLPENLHFIPLDFEQQTLQQALERSPLSLELQIFFAWLGTTFYLSRETVVSTLRTIATIAPPGSEIVFDYLVPDELVPRAKRAALLATRKFAAQRGEPVISTFTQAEMAEAARVTGFGVVEDLSSDDLEKRYFSSRKDDLTPMPGSRLVRLRLEANRLP